MASGGEGFGTERARLGQGGFSAERARLAQGGFQGQFYRRNPFKQNVSKRQKFAKILTEDPILLHSKFKKSISQ